MKEEILVPIIVIGVIIILIAIALAVIVNSWRKPESTEKLRFSKSFYNYLQPGSSTITITTKPGKFGFEWIVELE
jgi:hypothetical protein